MRDFYRSYTDALNQQFARPFDEAYRTGNKRRRAKLLPYIANIYRRWYYSTLVENTYLTPANIFESINRAHGKTPDESPSVRLRTPVNFTGFTFDTHPYTLGKHPVVEDFRKFITLCQPDIELTEDDYPQVDFALEIAKQLHIWDTHYVTFLLDVAVAMGLIKKIPSIYANRAQVTNEERLNIPDSELFDKIVAASVTFAANSLSAIAPLSTPLYDEAYIRKILQEPEETEAIFQMMYDCMGVELEELAEFDPFEEDFDGLEMSVITGTYLLGITLDRFFFAPFGHYLKLIRPVYSLPFDFESEIYLFLESTQEEDQAHTAFFAPCSQYFLTEIGLSYFGVEPSPENHIDIEINLPFGKIEPLFNEYGFEVRKITSIPDFTPPGLLEFCEMYSLKVRYTPDPRLWLNIDVFAHTTLHRLFQELSMYFPVNPQSEYTFFTDTTENPFTSYASPNQSRRAKKATDATFGELGLQEKQVLVLSVKGYAKWTLEIRKIVENGGRQGYQPDVSRLGKALQDFIEWD